MKSTSHHRFIGFIALLLLTPLLAFGQTTNVTGVVKDATGNPIIGASVLEIGTSNGAITDLDGHYQIKVSEKAKLRISYVGYKTQEIFVAGNSVVNVTLQDNEAVLNEIVVVGYGTMKKSDLTGAITSVKSDAIDKSVVTSVDQVLQGRAAGVQITQNSGDPGSSSSVRIRGVSSINSGNEPIYVIDGVIIDGNSGSNTTNPLSSINPADIETMDILKDASATAIYGSRASNGVIIITTKRGKSGEGRINYNGYAGWQEMPKKLDLLNLQKYATLKNERAAAGLIYADDRFVNPDLLGKGTDWQDALFSKASMTNHTLSFSGGNETTTYIFSGGYLDQDGIAAGSGLKRFTIRANVDSKIKKWLKAGVDLNFSNQTKKLTVSDESLIKIAWKQTPDVAVKSADGSWDGPETTEYVQTNPLALAMITTNNRNYSEIRGNLYFDATIFKGLTYKPEFSFNYGFNNTYKFVPTYTFGALENTVNYSERTKIYTQGWTFRNVLTYNNTFNKVHNLNIMLGQEMQQYKYNSLYAYRSGFLSNSSTSLNLGDSETATNTESYDYSAMSSQFGRLFYSFDDKYLLTATLRHDGSSKFAEGHQWGWFPSSAFAWKLSNENFLKDNKTIYNLKLRLGWGLVGNQNITSYSYTSLLTTTPTNWGTGVLAENTANPDLTWEKTASSNIGVDLGLFKGRIDFTLDFYYKKTNDLLMQLTLPAYVGTSGTGSASSPWGNVGSLSNKGFEFSINTDNINNKNFGWKTGIVFSMNKNKVLSMDTESGTVDGTVTEGSETTIVTRTAKGHSIGEFYGYQIAGRFNKAADFYYYDKNGDVAEIARPDGVDIGSSGAWIGDLIIKDQNGDGVIDASDRTYIGSPLPKFTYGINNTFTYKNFDLSISLTGSYGNKVINYQRRWLDNPASTSNVFKRAMNYAKLSKIDDSGPDNDYRNLYISSGDPLMPRMTSGGYNAWNYYFSDRFIEDGSYLRINSISFGYNLPSNITKKLSMQNCKLYANLQNIYTFSRYSGCDPEVGSMNQNALLTGIDNARYPSPRIYTFGLNITF